jgi:hypothetical protein
VASTARVRIRRRRGDQAVVGVRNAAHQLMKIFDHARCDAMGCDLAYILLFTIPAAGSCLASLRSVM